MSVFAELRIALRTLLSARGFTGAAILTLGLGLALCAAVLVVVNAYLLRDLPYPGASRLYWIRYDRPGTPSPRALTGLDWRSVDRLVEHRIAWDLDVFYLIGGSHPEAVQGAWVPPGFMDGLGVRPAIGRGFDAEAYETGSPQVALISHRLWQTRFAADPAIVGRRFDAYVSDRPDEAESFTIIGVLPADFFHINPFTSVLTPLRAPTYPYMARLREGVTPAEAGAAVTALVRAGVPNVPADWQVDVRSTHGEYVARMRPILRAAAGAAGLVLLISLANVAGLLLIRATRRQKEMAIRVALGAGRAAIVRMLFIEALVLGAAATVVALAAGGLTIRLLSSTIQRELGRPAPSAFGIDPTVIGIAAALGLIATLACGAAPLAALWRVGILKSLHAGSRTMTEARGTHRARSALIALQVAGSLALLSAGTLMIRSVGELLRVDFGIGARGVLTASMTLRQRTYPDEASRIALYARLLPRLAAVPGAEHVALASGWPLQAPASAQMDLDHGGIRSRISAPVIPVTAEYFTTLRVPTTAGRTIAPLDRAGAEPVAVVSETFARRVAPDGAAIGARITVLPERDPPGPPAVTRRIVGIVRDVRQTPDDRELADVYVPLLQTAGRFVWVYMRAAGEPAGMLAALRSAAAEIDPEIALGMARPLQAALDEQRARPAFLAWLLTGFAVIAAALALIGVYGVIAYAVRQREREIAVRMAIGASPEAITRLFTMHGGLVVAAGLVLGIPAALAAGRAVESQLFGVRPADPISLGMTTVTFAVAGLLAVWWPARRAASADPAAALKDE